MKISGSDVLLMLRPNGGWIISGDDFDSIQWIHIEPITKKQFEDGFNQVEAFKAQQATEAEAKKQALLDRLGITAEEARLLLS
jgi:hypothetical protein